MFGKMLYIDSNILSTLADVYYGVSQGRQEKREFPLWLSQYRVWIKNRYDTAATTV